MAVYKWMVKTNKGGQKKSSDRLDVIQRIYMYVLGISMRSGPRARSMYLRCGRPRCAHA